MPSISSALSLIGFAKKGAPYYSCHRLCTLHIQKYPKACVPCTELHVIKFGIIPGLFIIISSELGIIPGFRAKLEIIPCMEHRPKSFSRFSLTLLHIFYCFSFCWNDMVYGQKVKLAEYISQITCPIDVDSFMLLWKSLDRSSVKSKKLRCLYEKMKPPGQHTPVLQGSSNLTDCLVKYTGFRDPLQSQIKY